MKKTKVTPKYDKEFYRWSSFLLIVIFGYLCIRGVKTYYSDLSEIKIRLRKNPEVIKSGMKGRTYKSLKFTSYEYKNTFKLRYDWYNAADIDAIYAGIFDGDSVNVLVNKDDVDNLNDNSFFGNNDNEIYGIKKAGKEYIDFKLIQDFEENDKKIYYLLVLIGIILIPYGFINKPLISSKTAVISLIITLTLLVVFLDKFGK